MEIKKEGIPFQEAIDYWQNRVPTTRRIEFDEQTEMLRDRAFIITKLTKLQHIQRVHEKIAKGLETGIGTDAVVKELKKGRQGIPLSQGHLETIVRTNYALAYSAGRWTQIERTKERRPYLEYLCAVDGRERPSHRALDGKIYPVDDPFWKVNFPPNGFNCRCDVATVSQAKVDRIIADTGKDPVLRTSADRDPIALDNNFNFIPGTPPKPDLTKYEDVYRESFLNDIARHFGVEAAGLVRMKKYFNAGDVADATILNRIKQYDRKAYAGLVNDAAASNFMAEGKIMMVGRLPKAVRDWFHNNMQGSLPKFSLITIGDNRLMHMQRSAKATTHLLNQNQILEIPELLHNPQSRWYWDGQNNPYRSSILVFSEDVNGNLIRVSLKIDDNGTVYVATADIITDKNQELQKNYIKLK